MNDVIQNLKKEAVELVVSHGAFGEPENYTELNVDKFAELLVRECVTCMHYHLGDKPIWEAEQAVFEYFGIK